MAEVVRRKRYRGSSVQNDELIGLPGEISIDLTNNCLRVHDGVKPGGYMIPNQADITAALNALKQSVEQKIPEGNYLPITGGTVTGEIVTDSLLVKGGRIYLGDKNKYIYLE